MSFYKAEPSRIFFKLSSQRKIQRRGTFNLDSEKMGTDFLDLRDM